jgi:hypothetical protein
MTILKYFVVASVMATCFAVTAPKAAAQVAVAVGVARPIVLMGITMLRRTLAPLTVITGRSGLREAYLLAPGLGFMGLLNFAVT